MASRTTQAAVLLEQPGRWEVVDVTVDDPGPDDVLVRMVASGLCHSDDHVARGDAPAGHLPFCGGHEGAGVVEAVGADVRLVAPGDHVVTSFLPVCRTCSWCRSGREYLCDGSGLVGSVTKPFRMHLNGEPVLQCAQVGSFAGLSTVPAWACIPVDPALPLTSVALVGCGVPTGWGSATNAAKVADGDTVIVMGAGGVGINAVQGARHAGAAAVIAVDPVELKRELARTVGATHAVGSMGEAAELARSLTGGRGAQSAIVTVGVASGDHVAEAFAAVGKGGTVVLTAIANAEVVGLPVNLRELAMAQKTITGALYGLMSPTTDVPELLRLYAEGALRLDELVTRTYRLDQINDAYDDLHAGRNLRGVVVFD